MTACSAMASAFGIVCGLFLFVYIILTLARWRRESQIRPSYPRTDEIEKRAKWYREAVRDQHNRRVKQEFGSPRSPAPMPVRRPSSTPSSRSSTTTTIRSDDYYRPSDDWHSPSPPPSAPPPSYSGGGGRFAGAGASGGWSDATYSSSSDGESSGGGGDSSSSSGGSSD